MSRGQRQQQESGNEAQVSAPPQEEFIPSAPRAQYRGNVEIHETSGPIFQEDDQMFTEWFNPTQTDVVLEVHIGTDPKGKKWVAAFNSAPAAKRAELRTGHRIFIVKAGQTREIPSEYDLAVQRTHCLHPQCNAKKDCCQDLDHPRVVVAGLAPQLVCKKWHKVPSLSANLDQARSQAEAAVKALSEASAQKISAEMETAQARRLLEEAQRAAQEALEAKMRAEQELDRERRARVEAEKRALG